MPAVLLALGAVLVVAGVYVAFSLGPALVVAGVFLLVAGADLADVFVRAPKVTQPAKRERWTGLDEAA
jgi:hypothetical protein